MKIKTTMLAALVALITPALAGTPVRVQWVSLPKSEGGGFFCIDLDDQMIAENALHGRSILDLLING